MEERKIKKERKKKEMHGLICYAATSINIMYD